MFFIPKAFNSLSSFKIQILWVIALLLISYFLYFSVEHAFSKSNGFASYYTASRLLIEGENPTEYYNDEYFSSKVENYVPGIYEIYLVNLPTTTFLVLPFSVFDHETARSLWLTINILLLSLTIGFLIRGNKYYNGWLPFVLILFFSFQPLYANVVAAQAYILIFCGLTVIFVGYMKGDRKLPGIVTGLIVILKSAGTYLLLLFIIRKNWKNLLWSVITIIFLFLVTIPFLGFDSWIAYSNKLMNYSSSPTLSVTAYQTIHSFFAHLFIFDAKWNPEPIINLEIVGILLTIVSSLIILALTIFSIIKHKKPDLAFGLFVIAGLILNPASIDYHYMLILVPVLILIDWLRRNPSKYLWILFGVSFVLIALKIPYVSPKVTGGYLALFAYPKLYGAVGLWLLGLRASRIQKHQFVAGEF